MKLKNILFTCILASVLLLSACSSNEAIASEGAFIGGTDGVTVTFEPFSVLEDGFYTIFDTEDFPIDVLIRNKGEHEIAAGEVTLKLLGPAQNDFANIPSWTLDNVEEIEKISEFNPEGDEELISFTPNDYATFLGTVTTFHDIPFLIDYEYDYQTFLIVNDVCFKEDAADDRLCEVKETKSHAVSAAPITETKVEEDTAGKGVVVLKIDVSNANTGKSTIIGEDFDNRFSQVAYEIDNPADWECKSGGRENEARLVDGKAQIICKLVEPLTEDELYVNSVRLTLSYTYNDIVQETLRVLESVE